MTASGERRAAPRARYTGIVMLDAEGHTLPCVAGNLSETGMLVYPRLWTRTSIGQPVRLEFSLPDLPDWISVPGTVVRNASNAEHIGWGIAFARLTDPVKTSLRAFVHAISA